MYYDSLLRVGAFGCSRQGASHKRSEPLTPCQDAFHLSNGTIAAQPYLVAAVADGHGDKKYERSEIGSHFATQAATRVFLRFLLQMHSNSGIVRSFRSDFALALHKEWKSLVDEHLAGLGESPASTNPYQLYGTTLLFAAVIENAILLAKIGDGDIEILKKDGSHEESIFSEDRQQVGGATDSLCAANAIQKIQTWGRQGADYISTIKAITISTDGLSNAVEEKDFHALLSQIVDKVLKAYSGVDIASLLDNFSQCGSGDDVTLVGLCFGASTTTVEPSKPLEAEPASDIPQGIQSSNEPVLP